MTDSEPIPVADPTWKRDFPYEASAEEDVTRREFARYLVAGAGAMAAGNVGLAIWTQLRTINTGEPRAVTPLAGVAVGETHLFRYPEERDPAILVRLMVLVIAWSMTSAVLSVRNRRKVSRIRSKITTDSFTE